MKRLGIALLIVGLCWTMGCVIRTHHTIDAHITIDIRYVSDQAENVLDYIEQKSDTIEPVAPSTGWLDRALDALMPIRVAYAAEAEMKETSALITQIATKLRERFPKMQELKKQSIVGEDNRGYVEIRNEAKLTDPQKKNEIQKVVAAENEDRKALYKEVARLNKEKNLTVAIVERIYAQKRLKRAVPGEIFQLPPTGPDFEEFKKSEPGKKLAGECKPGAWVTIK